MEDTLWAPKVQLTEVLFRITGTSALLPIVALFGAVGEWWVLVADLVEEVNLVFRKEECSCYAVNWGVSPSLDTILASCSR